MIDFCLRPLRESDLALVYKSWIGVAWEHWRWSTSRCKRCSARFTYIGRDAFSDGMHARISRLLARAQSAAITREDKQDSDWLMGFAVWEPGVLHALYLAKSWRRMGIGCRILDKSGVRIQENMPNLGGNLGERIQTPPDGSCDKMAQPIDRLSHQDGSIANLSSPCVKSDTPSIGSAEDSRFPSDNNSLHTDTRMDSTSGRARTQESSVILEGLDTPRGIGSDPAQRDGHLGGKRDRKPPSFYFTQDSRAMAVMRKKWNCAYNPFLVE